MEEVTQQPAASATEVVKEVFAPVTLSRFRESVKFFCDVCVKARQQKLFVLQGKFFLRADGFARFGHLIWL